MRIETNLDKNKGPIEMTLYGEEGNVLSIESPEIFESIEKHKSLKQAIFIPQIEKRIADLKLNISRNKDKIKEFENWIQQLKIK